MAIQNSTGSVRVDNQGGIKADSQHGLIGSWWQLAVGTAESSCNFGFGMAQDTRAELRRRADVTLSFAEELGVGTVKFVRGIVDRVDHVANEGLGRGEAAVLVTTRALRTAGQRANAKELSSTTHEPNGSGTQWKSDGMRSATT